MSNVITYDSLLVDYLARELEERLRHRRLRGARLDAESRRFVLELDDDRLVWELHPTRGWLRLLGDGVHGGAAEGWGGREVATPRRPRIRSVWAPPDERWLVIDLDAAAPGRASRFVVELMTNQWNVLALAASGVIVAALWARDAGERALRAGQPYVAPDGSRPDGGGADGAGPGGVEASARRAGSGDAGAAATRREGASSPIPFARWRELLGDLPPVERRRVLVRSVAWTSPLNVGAILGEAGSSDSDGDAALRGAWERYTALAMLPPARPRVLALRAPQPYPLPLPGVEDRPATSLLSAFAATLEGGAGGVAPEVAEALEARLERVRARAARLHAEAESAPEKAAGLRRRADLLMAQLHAVPRGAAEAELDDFEGGRVVVPLDPALSAPENAQALYDRARKRERAAERLPARVREAVAEQNRLESLLASLEAGEADAAEVERWLSRVRPESGDGASDAERRPYQLFRSSGGLEIRVGRSGRGNDDLTFHHSSPDDIWLHARDVAGAHVILRWGDREQNPPKRDLLEAAILAALGSKARTSGTVPVDWTRRKYVRKPRKAPPGAVLPDRVSTVFVEPDPGLPDRLREE